MSDMSFTWRGESSDAHGVVVRNLPPIYSPQVRDEAVPIPGRSGALHMQDGAYEEQLMMLEGYLPYEQGVVVSPIETIKAWLSGAGDLTLSDQPDRRYKARIIDAIAFTPWVQGFADRIFSASFWADPLAYEADPEVIRMLGPRTIENPGTVPAAPLIRIKGSGRVTLTVGDITISLDNLSGTVTIDCDAMSAYLGTDASGTATAITLDDHAWPVLGLDSTRISWTGSVSQVEIEPNWRWL